MNQQDRELVVTADRERKAALGVFAVVCSATGNVWIGQSRQLDTHRDSLWFALRRGTSPYRSLQAFWTIHGEDAFRFEELERLRDDYPEIGVKDELEGRAALWKARLEAESLA